MKELLTALRSRIADNIVYLGGSKAVHIVPDEDLLPETTPFPCVALKDGEISTRYYQNMTRRFMDVAVIAYVNINSPDGPILGTSRQAGILDLMDDLREQLVNYDPDGYQNMVQDEAFETGSQTMDFGDIMVQKKKMVLRWVTS